MDALIPLHRLSDAWEQAGPWIESALPYAQGDENLRDILIGCASGRYSLWWEPDRLAVVLLLQKAPRQTVLTLCYAGGVDLKSMRDGFEHIRVWARSHGVDVLRICGRKGWERQLSLRRVGVILQVEA